MTLTVSTLYKRLFQNHPITTWENADEVIPKSLIKKVVTKKFTRYLDISSIKVMQISSNASGNLYIFDYGSPQLCGAGGCLYSVYNSDGNTLLEFIANPKLPKSQKLIKIGVNVNQGFPCLNITQMTDTDKLLSQTEFCYQNGNYVPLNKNFITEKK
ncbi:MAG: histidine kinase [Rivularia sp. (in: Bacteria)]|nr:histidine kinase [Rivularia sp. MS3]